MRALVKLRKIFFISLQKLFSFLRKSSFRVVDFQILWRHQMPKHKTNTFHWITWEVNTVYYWNLASLSHITKENNLSENSTKIAARKVVPGPYVFAKDLAQLQLENQTCLICPNQHAGLLRFFFTDSLKIKKGPELVSRHFSQNFLINNFIL